MLPVGLFGNCSVITCLFGSLEFNEKGTMFLPKKMESDKIINKLNAPVRQSTNKNLILNFILNCLLWALHNLDNLCFHNFEI